MPNRERDERIRELANQGKSQRAIAAELRCSLRDVNAVLKGTVTAVTTGSGATAYVTSGVDVTEHVTKVTRLIAGLRSDVKVIEQQLRMLGVESRHLTELFGPLTSRLASYEAERNERLDMPASTDPTTDPLSLV